MTDIFRQIADAVYNGDEILVDRLAEEVIEKKINPADAIQKGGLAGLDRLSEDVDLKLASLPHQILAGQAMKLLIEKITPYMKVGEQGCQGTVVIGCAEGDLHDLGKNLVATQLAVNGFKVIDLGVDVNTNKFIDAALQHDADIIAVSALMDSSAYCVEDLTRRLKKGDAKYKFMALVGGGKVDPRMAGRVEADGYAKDAFSAVQICKQLMRKAGGAELIN